MIIRPHSSTHKNASWVVYFDRSEKGAWTPERDGIYLVKVYDVTAAGDFTWVGRVPDEVLSVMGGCLDQLDRNGARLIAVGKDRAEQERLLIASKIETAKLAALDEAKLCLSEIPEEKAALAAYGRRVLGEDFDLSEIDPDSVSQRFREIVDYGFGPMVLEVVGRETFLLSTPGRAKLVDDDGKACRFHAEWSDGQWRKAPQLSPIMSKLNDAVRSILSDHEEKFVAVTRMMIAERLADILINEQALTRYVSAGVNDQAPSPTGPRL